MFARRLRLWNRKLKSYRCLVTAAVALVVTATCLDLVTDGSSQSVISSKEIEWSRLRFDRQRKAKLATRRLVYTCSEIKRRAMSHSSENPARFVKHGIPIVEDGIYWSRYIEDMIPGAPSIGEMFDMVENLQSSTVVDISLELPPDCDHSSCSSPINAVVTMADQSKAYVRYKPSCWVYGEVMSFYFSVILCMNNVPPVSLARPDPSTRQWRDKTVQQTLRNKIEWASNTMVSMMTWIDNSTESFQYPEILVEGTKFIHPDNPKFDSLTLDGMALMAQFTDMVIFDYLTGNNDRVVYHLFYSLVKNDTGTLHSTTHNLQVDQARKKLWLVDNEVSFGIGYDMLTSHTFNVSYFFTDMLRSVCIFRRETIARISSFRRPADVAKVLWDMVATRDPLADIGYPSMTCDEDTDVKGRIEWASILAERIEDVLDWVAACQSFSYSDLNVIRTAP
ncbi:four-jointed box protein 1-like [Ptychodera flava]|uniref:four-jointed box protein 1-like n=1 Tax=Ptychodera flava TaxID=63121 RepID=UPI00396A965C